MLLDRKVDVLLMSDLRVLLENMLCPLTILTSDSLGPPLLNKVTEFLVSELQAACILKYKELHPEEKTMEEESVKEQRVKGLIDDYTKFCQQHEDGEVFDQSTRRMEMEAELKSLLQTLDMKASAQFADVLHEVESRLAVLPSGDMVEPLLNTHLNSKQWRQVDEINQMLLEDYQCRRQMMIKRFQVTLHSFAWGEKKKKNSAVLASVPPLASFAFPSQVSISLLLAARKDQSCILPVKAGPSTAVYKILTGAVPDRGGRPGEIEPPMPLWEGRRGQRNQSGRGSGCHQQRQKSSGKKKVKKE
ncbi:protein FAM98B isoform X2 [Lampris incognitus]|uniref:protein FAM98B isoform X2 n=1 Tax=Lampris incognitus TaxID=2546036 RepID=UPI0024B4F380|nr:protein FAM98B isoform X2 [Lampris incognitus]